MVVPVMTRAAAARLVGRQRQVWRPRRLHYRSHDDTSMPCHAIMMQCVAPYMQCVVMQHVTSVLVHDVNVHVGERSSHHN